MLAILSELEQKITDYYAERSKAVDQQCGNNDNAAIRRLNQLEAREIKDMDIVDSFKDLLKRHSLGG